MPLHSFSHPGRLAALLFLAASPCLHGQSTSVAAPLLASAAPFQPIAGAGSDAATLPDAPLPESQPTTQTTPSSSSTSDPLSTDPNTQQPAGPQNGPETQDPDAAAANGAHQTKRIAGIIPNYRSVSADQHLPPQTIKQKFTAAGKDSFDYGSFILAAVQAGIAINGNSYPEFGKGVLGYGRYYWRTLLDTADENFMVGGVLPSVVHQDPRFYTLGHGSIAHRALYASTRVLISRADNGSAMPNISEIVGAGAAAGISSTYYPERYQTWTKVGQKWLTSVLIDSANFTFKEFWPDINQRFVHQKE